MADDALIEAMARGAQALLCSPWEDLDEEEQRATLELHAAALAALRKTHAVVPREPSDGLLMSMALRYDHGLGLPGYYDMSDTPHAQRLESTLGTMRQLHEEVVGTGFYQPEKDDQYRAMLIKASEDSAHG